MSYNGYLIKLGSYTFPVNYIEADSYKVTKKILDLDSYRDTNGILHRNALSHSSYTVTFNTGDNIPESVKDTIMSGLNGSYSNAAERKCSCSFYVPELGSYVTQDMYVADIDFTISRVTGSGLLFKSIPFNLIGY